MRSIVSRGLPESRLVVAARMLVALPEIDPNATRARPVLGGRLAEREVALPAIDPQLDEQTRPQQRDQVVGEMEVARPRADAVNEWLEVARRQIRLDNFLPHASGSN